MAREWSHEAEQHIHLYADCIPVRGAAKSAFYDLTRHEIVSFPTVYLSLLDVILGKRVKDVISSDRIGFPLDYVLAFLNFLDEHEFLMLVADPSEYPPIANVWDFPGHIQNAIIDVETVAHDIPKILRDLSALGCQFLQVRGFTGTLTYDQCNQLLLQARHKTFLGVEVIVKYETSVAEELYVTLMKQHPILTGLTIHSAPESKRVMVDTTAPVYYKGAPRRQIRFTQQVITSDKDCGVINQRQLTPPSPESFFESRSYNGCLNRKVSIDSMGRVKNCPSMAESYGDISNASLKEIVKLDVFQEKWSISKDKVSVCKECEFRYACSDCRAYLDNPQDLLSKPLKCGYDPYTGLWEDWRRNGLKRNTAKLYGITIAEQ